MISLFRAICPITYVGHLQPPDTLTLGSQPQRIDVFGTSFSACVLEQDQCDDAAVTYIQDQQVYT
jgi:hypothetical protein